MSPAKEDNQKCALVTGSSNGIGEAIVLALAKLDYKLVVTGRSRSDVSRVAALCADQSPSKSKPLEVVADLGNEEDVRRLFEEARMHFGDRLDLLVNNAGLGIPVEHAQVKECWNSFKFTMQVNLMSAAQLTLLCAPLLKQTARNLREKEKYSSSADDDIGASTLNRQATTSVINIGSLAAHRPTQSLAAYGTSKCALDFYSKCMAVELAPYVRVNCINPGPVATKIIERAGFDLDQFREISNQLSPLKRLAEPTEVAHSVLFLADYERAGYITGASLTIDGGCVLIPLQWNFPATG